MRSDPIRLRHTRPGWARAALASGAVLALGTAAPGHAALESPWWSAVADAAGDCGYFTSQALDGRGRPHVAYADIGRAALKYATRRGADWDTVTVARITGQTGWHTAVALALDRDGAPRIAYQDELHGDLRYAWRTAAGWQTQAVDTAGVVGAHVSMCVDGAGHAHIAYYDEDRRALRHAWHDGVRWQLEAADSVDAFAVRDVGEYSSIATDAANEPHIAYYDAAAGDLKYAVRRGGAWTVRTLDVLGDVGRYTAIALDPHGRAAIGYTDFANVSSSPGLTAAARHGKHVKYARERADGSWDIEVADGIGYGAQYVSLALDATERMRLAYYDYFEVRVKYAVEGVDGWDIQYPGLPVFAGDFPSLVLDPSGAPAFSYLDLTAPRGQLAYLSQGLALRLPRASTRWAAGDSATVEWDGGGPVDIELSLDDGATWSTLATAAAGGVARVRTPATPSPAARLRLTRLSPYARVESDTTFAVGDPPPVLRLLASPGLTAGLRATLTPPPAQTGGTTASWSVYDVRGRRWAHGTTGALRAGVPVTLAWDGRTANGRPAPRGSYWWQVEGRGYVARAHGVLVQRASEETGTP